MVSHWLGAAWEAGENLKLLSAEDHQLTVLLAAEQVAGDHFTGLRAATSPKSHDSYFLSSS